MSNADSLSNLANILQIASFLLLTNEASNNKILEELQHQNKEYLEKAIRQNIVIIEQNEKILERLQNVRFTKS